MGGIFTGGYLRGGFLIKTWSEAHDYAFETPTTRVYLKRNIPLLLKWLLYALKNNDNGISPCPKIGG